MLNNFFTFLLSITQGMGYSGVAFLMAVESSFIPMPSEVIIPPAAYLASQGTMNVYLVVLAGVIGSLLGAIFNYYLAYYLGRPLVYKLSGHRFAKFLFISPGKVERAEKYFFENAVTATFVGRLIPVIRQLISLPAGFSKMPFGKFILYTALGSSIWVAILAALGYFIGANQDRLMLYYNELKWGLLSLAFIWLAFRVFKTVKKKNAI